MKRRFCILVVVILLLSGCTVPQQARIAATTLPVYQFTCRIAEGTDLTVARLVTESVSCLHDYTLTVRQMKAIEGAETVIISGAGLEEFLEEALSGTEAVIDASAGIALMEGDHHHHHEGEAHDHEPEHHHEADPHIWLSPVCAMDQARNICAGLSEQYPQYAQIFARNLEGLLAELGALDEYARQQLSALRCRQILTFHDGFSYLCREYDIEIVEAIEEESGAEASAQELIHMVEEIRQHGISAIFVERNGSGSAASIIAAETDAGLYTLDMAMSGDDYFSSMYANIDTLKEALK